MEVVSNKQSRRPVSIGLSGAGMDRQIEQKKLPLARIGAGAGVLSFIVAIAWFLIDQAGSRTLSLDNSRLVTAQVSEGLFEDYIPIRGRVTPRKTVYLDVIEGGQVEQRLVEDGAMVKAGDLLVVLSNTAMQLDVTRNEAMVTEQLNNMRTIELQLEQNRLQHKRDLVEIDYQIQRLTRSVDRLANLDSAGVAAKSQLEDARDELDYNVKKRRVTVESQTTDARLQETQLQFLHESAEQLQASLALARRNLDALNVRAPVDGKLSGLDVEIGQSIERGGRLGQIDDPDSHKLRVEVDEFYLGRVDIGLPAHFEDGGRRFDLTVDKIYPQVTNGQFALDLLFDDQEPGDIRRGQTIQATLTLGDTVPAMLIPNGAFYQDTGGNWMFVVDESGTTAVRRSVKLGRRNAKYIEVLDGLEKGETVVVSPYSSFKEMDRLNLSSD